MAITLPHSAITEIPNTEPAATPALWNTRYNEIDENFERLATYTPVGTSSTAAGTKAKAVTINGFSLSTNAFVLVKFSNANTASAPTLNVSNTGAKAIYFNGAAVPTGYLEANKFYHFVYDGSHWVLTGDVDVRHLYLPLAGGTITGNLAVQGTTTLTGLLTANGGVTTKKLTATELDLNGNADISGTLKVTGASTLTGLLTANGGVTTKVLSATDVTASGTLKVTGATTLTGALAANGGTTTTTLKATGTSTLAAVNATNISASGTLKVTGATTLTGALAANGGLTTTTIKATGTSTLAAVNATNISASGTLSVTGTSTLTGKLTANGGVTTKALTATSLDLNGNGDVSGTWKVTGATTLTGLLTANGGVTTKKVTATELDLNGNGDVSGNLNVGGSLQVTGHLTADGNLTAQNVVSRTGYFGVNTGTKSYYPIAVVDYDENGGFCGYRGFGGMTAIGSGESVAALQNSVETEFGMGHGSENLFVCSDQGIWFLPECNSWSNHGTYQLQTNGLCRRLMDVAKGDAIENTRFLQFFLCDKNGNSGASRFAGFEANTRNGTQAMLMAYDPSASSSTYAYLGLAYSSDGVVTTHAPTPPTGDRSTQIATTASFDNEGFIGYKKLTAIQSVKGSFWFDSDSGIDLDDAHLSDIVSGADWYGIQFGMTRGADKSQYLFNSAGIWRRYSDANLGSETWGDWTQIVNTKGLIAATAPEPVTESLSCLKHKRGRP